MCETDQKVMDALVSGQLAAAFLCAACPVLAPGYLASAVYYWTLSLGSLSAQGLVQPRSLLG